MEKLAQEILPFVIIISVLITVICLLVKFILFLWYSLFGETPREQYHSVPYVYKPATPKLRRVIALDTEMVGTGYRGSINALARVSLVDQHGWDYDTYVEPRLPVTDYRTKYSGIRQLDLIKTKNFYSVRLEVAEILEGCILVGHDLEKDLNILDLTHPSEDIRDTALHIPFRRILARDYTERQKTITSSNLNDHLHQVNKIMREKPKLKTLAKVILGRDIQMETHCSVEDAQAALDLFYEFEYNRQKFT